MHFINLATHILQLNYYSMQTTIHVFVIRIQRV